MQIGFRPMMYTQTKNVKPSEVPPKNETKDLSSEKESIDTTLKSIKSIINPPPERDTGWQHIDDFERALYGLAKTE